MVFVRVPGKAQKSAFVLPSGCLTHAPHSAIAPASPVIMLATEGERARRPANQQQQPQQPQQQQPPPPYFPPEGPYYSIDVECVATSRDHNGRAVAQIALVDSNLQCLLNLYVKPEVEVVSYLSPLTGLDENLLQNFGIPLADALAQLRQMLPKNAILVGQNIRSDVNWLKLQEGTDFAAMIDLLGLYRVWNAKYKNWSQFSQDHCAKTLLGVESKDEPHNAVTDAGKSMRLFHLHREFQADSAKWEAAQASLLGTEPEMSFARRNPEFEGCCMGNRKTCKDD